MATQVQQNLVSSNDGYVSHFNQGDLALPPAKHYLIVTCMDARIDPVQAFGIKLGDAHVVRNAGGSAAEGLRSIVISQQLLGTKEVLLIKHTDCGMTHFTPDIAYQKIEGSLGSKAKEQAKGIEFLTFPEVEQAVKDEVKLLRASELIDNSVAISGWVYDVKTGKVGHIL